MSKGTMISVIIKDNNEPNVIKLTYENLWRELKDIPDAELLVDSDWFAPLSRVQNKYVCFVEADCLVSSGYFSSQLGLFKKNPFFRKLAVLSSCVGVNNWANRFYGYSLGNNYSDGVIPNKGMKSSKPYPLQIAYIPGSIVRLSMLRELLTDLDPSTSWQNDLVYMSAQLSLGFWQQGDGNRVDINPNTTYVTTEDYVNDLGKFPIGSQELVDMFKREGIS